MDVSVKALSEASVLDLYGVPGEVRSTRLEGTARLSSRGVASRRVVVPAGARHLTALERKWASKLHAFKTLPPP